MVSIFFRPPNHSFSAPMFQKSYSKVFDISVGAISYGQVNYIHVLGTTIKACHETDTHLTCH